MTALTAPAPAPAARHPHAPRQARWLLRLHRAALYVWLGAVVVLVAALLWLGGPLTDSAAAAWRAYDACGMNERCSYDQDAIVLYKDVLQYTTLAVLAIPFLVAAWAGGALTGREMEDGTAQLTWTQGVSPVRWLAAKLALPGVLVALGTGALVLLHHRAWSAGEGRIDTAKPWYDFGTFYAGGVLTVALALAGLAAGALIGLLQRRSLAALGSGLCAAGLLWLGTHLVLPHLWPGVTSVSSLKTGGPTGSGIDLGSGLLTSTGARVADPQCGSSISPSCRALYDKLDAVSRYHDYHPRSHYWPLQLTGSALLLLVAALLVLAAFRLLRHRTGVAAPARKEAP